MRNIDQYSLNIPAGWITKAQSAEIDVANGLKTIEQCSYVWRELKNNLSKISNKCCWYCESEIARNDNAVDHFRPKGTVKGLHYALSFDDENEGWEIWNLHHMQDRLSNQRGTQHMSKAAGSAGAAWGS